MTLPRLARMRDLVGCLLSSVCLVGCQQNGSYSYPDCDQPSGLLKLESTSSLMESGRIDRVMRFKARPSSWIVLPKDRHEIFDIKVKVSAPAGAGTYECGDTTKPCQATLELAERNENVPADPLSGKIVVSAEGTLVADFETARRRGLPCPVVRFTFKDVPLSYH
jgi:hypothetical protein